MSADVFSDPSNNPDSQPVRDEIQAKDAYQTHPAHTPPLTPHTLCQQQPWQHRHEGCLGKNIFSFGKAQRVYTLTQARTHIHVTLNDTH